MIKYLKDIKINEIHLFGGKAVNLGFLIQTGFNVPEGFCISTQVKKIDKEIKNEVIERYKKLKSKVSVRSSATAEDAKNASFAGQFDSFLNIKDEKELINSVEKCKTSVKSARVNAYLKNKNVAKVKMAVIVQKMIDADYAGVIFTVDPVNEKYILVEIVKGIGDKMVSGRVTPNSYFVHKGKFLIQSQNESFNLGKNILKKLTNLALRIESVYSSPQDIEFAVKDNRIFILQSRPITTL